MSTIVGLVITVLSATVVLGPEASAGQIDNDSGVDMYAYFICGVSCGGVLRLESGGSVATTLDGNVHAGLPVKPADRRSPWICETSNLWVEVKSGGEVGVTFDPGEKDADDNPVAASSMFTWTSKSGYDPGFTKTNGAISLGGDGSYCWGAHW